MQLSQAHVRNCLTRTSGYLQTVSSHSLQPYRGCALGRSLCGVGCYVQHNRWITHGRAWGGFVEVRTNAAEAYRQHHRHERDWARGSRGRFGIFLSSSTEPFQPAEGKYRVTQKVLEAMVDLPPDFLILQTHSHRVIQYAELYERLRRVCDLRFHISIETDREEMEGLPPHASSVEKRIEACVALRAAGHRVVVTVSPLLPMAGPERFFARLSEVADAVVIDHFIEGDGTPDGGRTRKTPLPVVMEALDPRSVSIRYRDQIVRIAQRFFPGRVGISIDGFAGRMLEQAAV